MKVYYNSSLLSTGKGFPGLPQTVDWEFEYAGNKCYIPVIYRFSTGIVFDIIVLLDEGKLRGYYDKYKDIEDSLTPLQGQCAQREHPYQSLSVSEVWINNKLVEGGFSSSSAISIPWEEQNIELMDIGKAYSSTLKNPSCFACERFCVPYPKVDSMASRLSRLLRMGRVKGLKFSTWPRDRFYPLNIHFNMSSGDKTKEIRFQHPLTSTHHILYIQNFRPIEIPFDRGGNHSLYATQAMYEIDPKLPEGDTLQFDSGMQYNEPIGMEGGLVPTAASSIGIIGGADGPTSVFITIKNGAEISKGLKGLPLYSCLSIPGFQKKDISHFILEGISIREVDSREYKFG